MFISLRAILIPCAALLAAIAAAPAGAAPFASESPVLSYGNLHDTSGAVGPTLAQNPDQASQLVAAATTTGSARTLIATSDDAGATWQTRTPPVYFPPTFVPGTVSNGEASVTYGNDRDGLGTTLRRVAYLAEVTRGASDVTACAGPSDGIALSASPDARTWRSIANVDTASAGAAVRAPRVAYDTVSGRLLVVYERRIYAAPDCSGFPARTEIWLAWSDNAGDLAASFTRMRIASSGFEPSLAVGSGGHVTVVYWDGTSNVNAVTCAPAGASCAAPVRLDGGVRDPGTLGGIAANPQPDVAHGVDAAGRDRLVAVWASGTVGGPAQVRSATSFDGGATFTPPATAEPASADQFDPRLAPAPGTANGRVDLAFEQSTGGGGFVVRTASSDEPPAGTGETWSSAISAAAAPSNLGASGGGSPHGWLAVAGLQSSAGAATPLRLVWVDTHTAVAGDPSDIHATSLAHGSLAPAFPDAAFQVAAGTPVALPLSASDADADPLHWTLTASPQHGRATFANTLAPQLTYTPDAGYVGSDVLAVTVTDGVHAATATIHLQVGNSPPTIFCGALTTGVDTPLSLDLATCVTDPNGDAFTLSAGSPQNGTLNDAGTVFTPASGFLGRAAFTLTAVDARGAASSAVITVNVVNNRVARIEIASPPSNRIVPRGQPVDFRATTSDDPTGAHRLVRWRFSDRSGQLYEGSPVTRIFRKVGVVTATAMVEGLPSQTVKVTVEPPPLELLSVKVTRTSVNVAVRVNDRGSVKLVLGHAAHVLKGVPAGHVKTVHFVLHHPLRLRTMLLAASLKPAHRPDLPNPTLHRAVTLPLR